MGCSLCFCWGVFVKAEFACHLKVRGFWTRVPKGIASKEKAYYLSWLLGSIPQVPLPVLFNWNGGKSHKRGHRVCPLA